jgi:rod shape determining protein RodA
MVVKEYVKNFDWLIFGVLLALLAVSIVFIWSASFHSLEGGQGYYESYAKKQIVWIIISFGAFLVVLLPNYKMLSRSAYVLYAIGLGLLLYVLVLGEPIRDAKRWIRIASFSLQPSEFMKIIFIIALARYLMYRKNVRTLKGLIIPFVMTLVPMALIVVEPDLGTGMVFMFILFALLFVAGAKIKHLASIVAMGLFSFPFFYQFLLKPYQRMRIISFILSWLDKEKQLWLLTKLGLADQFKNFAYSVGWQLNQSLVAIGSGGPFGKGWGAGTQARFDFLPADHSDFIFAVIGEEWGFLGAGLIILLYGMIFLSGLGIAARTREPFGRLIAVGVVVLLASQVFINVGMTIGLMPITGLPLPFLSYGGSSLLSSFMALALLMNVGLRRLPVFASEDFA